MSEVKFCVIEKLNKDQANSWLNFKKNDNCKFFLGFFKSAVVWGKWTENKWVYIAEEKDIEPENLIEIRFFGEKQEFMFWNLDGKISGRKIADTASVDENSPFKPHIENRILFGDRLIKDNPDLGFYTVGDGKGAEQTLPIACKGDDFDSDKNFPLRLTVKSYFSEDKETGRVLCTANRLVNIYNTETKID